MEAKDLKAGCYYRAKKPRRLFDGGFNDRKILWISKDGEKVQYDSPTIGIGRHYPTVSMERFLKWVGKEITKEDYINTSGER
jgi:hypothetical protein